MTISSQCHYQELAESEPNGLAVKEQSGTTCQDRTLRESAPNPHLPPKEPRVKEILQTDDPSTKDIFNSKPMCFNRRDTNLWDILAHSTFSAHADPTLTKPAGTFCCHRRQRCTCDFTGRTKTVTSSKGDVRQKVRYDCTAAGVVYVIACQRCHKLYVGETDCRIADLFGPYVQCRVAIRPLVIPRRWIPRWRTL